MAFAFFMVPIRDDGEQQNAMNQFLAAHRVLSVDKKFVDSGVESSWCFCVDYLPHQPALTAAQRLIPGKNKIDYKDVLTPEQFAVFARLRDVRKEIALREAVPVYTIFTNEQLAQMAQAAPKTNADLNKIDGVGDARVVRYGPAFLAALGPAAQQAAP